MKFLSRFGESVAELVNVTKLLRHRVSSMDEKQA